MVVAPVGQPRIAQKPPSSPVVSTTTTQWLQASESSWGAVSAVPPSASMASTAAKRGAALGIHGVHGGPPLPPQHRVLRADTLAQKGGRMVDKSWNSKP